MTAPTTSTLCHHSSQTGTHEHEARHLIRRQLTSILIHIVDAETEALCQASSFQRCGDRIAHRVGRLHRRLLSRIGELTVSVPRLSLPDRQLAILPKRLRSIDHLVDAAICLSAGHNSWSAIQTILAPLRAHYGESEWIARLAQRLLQQAERSRRVVLPMRATVLRISGVAVAPCEHHLPPMVCISIEAGSAGTTLLATVERNDAQAWKRLALDLQQRGLLVVERILGPDAEGAALALQRRWPHSYVDDAPAPRIAL